MSGRTCTDSEGRSLCRRWHRGHCLLVRFFELRSERSEIPCPEEILAWIQAGRPRPAPRFSRISEELTDIKGRRWFASIYGEQGEQGDGPGDLARAHAAAAHLEGRGPPACSAFSPLECSALPPEEDPRALALRAWRGAAQQAGGPR